jgi:hypothetical protein
MKRTLVLAVVLLLASAALAVQRTGDTRVLEGLYGAKYSGAPSQALAGRLGVTFKHLEDVFHQPFLGKVDNPEELRKLGYDSIQKGDQIEMKRIEDHSWEIKHVKSRKTVRINVIS